MSRIEMKAITIAYEVLFHNARSEVVLLDVGRCLDTNCSLELRK